jgi:hypothetical protein
METNIQMETIEIGAEDGVDLEESLLGFSGRTLEDASKAEAIAMILRTRCHVQEITLNRETVTIQEGPQKIALIRKMLGELGLVEVGSPRIEHTPTPLPTLQERPGAGLVTGNPTINFLRDQNAWDDSWLLEAQIAAAGKEQEV